MITASTRLLLDSNVWLDLFASDRPGRDDAVELVTLATSQQTTLLFAASSIKDVYYLLNEREKRKIRAKNVEVTAGVAAAINEYAWGCVRAMEELATVVPIDQADLWIAAKYRAVHNDFEDNLVLAAMERSKADYLVTSDEVLLSKSPVAALAPHDAVALMA
ncbi:type II toxin-antitoxin system VapC family toxin [Arabiibacter massiliensis]|uniref:type II toxin-antitoxin system VapC family toxin n=1 Tax=Arabiibacter massiliensis TaxID=1870985 RepID=UPI0009BBECEE|nr:PIN domain-containing protein [Arabiibacter massiliensis]